MNYQNFDLLKPFLVFVGTPEAYGKLDADFVNQMVAQHQGAIDMTRSVVALYDFNGLAFHLWRPMVGVWPILNYYFSR